MKIYRLLYYVAVVFFTALSAQAQFQKLDLPEDVTYNDVYFSTPSTGFILGTKGTFLKTIDTGATWQKIEMDTAMFFLKAHFPTPEVGYIMAGTTAEARVIKTTDGGESWNVINKTIRGTGVVFVNADTGFIFSSHLLWKTTDGGQTWKMANPFGEVYDIAFPTQNIGYAVGTQSVQKTTDGGETWNVIRHHLIDNSTVSSCWFKNADTGMIFGHYAGLLAKTYDGGKTWISEVKNHQLEDDPSMSVWIIASDFPTNETGYALGAGILYKTKDGGEIWRGIRTDTSVSGNKVHFATEKIGFIFGGNSIFRATNGGEETVDVHDSEQFENAKENNPYPQPTKNSCTIPLVEGLSVQNWKIYNVQGRMVNHLFSVTILENKIILNNISAPQGKYFYSLYDEMNHTASNGSFIISP